MTRSSGEALSWKQWSQVKETIRSLRSRALMHLRHGITGEDLFHAFVNEEDKAVILRMFEICDISLHHQSMKFSMEVPDIEANGVTVLTHATFNMSLPPNAKFKFLMPTYMKSCALTKSSPQFENMVRDILTISFEWAQVYQVFYQLNRICKTPAQIHAACPAFGTMLVEHDATHKLGERLKAQKSKSYPAMPRELREMAYKIRGTIAKATITPNHTELPYDEITVGMVSAKTATPLPWNSTHPTWLLAPGNE